MSSDGIVTLTRAEIDHCAKVGRERNKLNGTHRCPYEQGESAEKNDILGCCGEHAFANLIGDPWDATVDTSKEVPDQSGCEVRTRRESWHELFVMPSEAEVPELMERAWILVRVWCRERFEFHVVGWQFGRNIAAHPLQDFGGRPVHALPNDKLFPMSDLPHTWEELR